MIYLDKHLITLNYTPPNTYKTCNICLKKLNYKKDIILIRNDITQKNILKNIILNYNAFSTLKAKLFKNYITYLIHDYINWLLWLAELKMTDIEKIKNETYLRELLKKFYKDQYDILLPNKIALNNLFIHFWLKNIDFYTYKQIPIYTIILPHIDLIITSLLNE